MSRDGKSSHVDITLTTFIDFVFASGTAKITCVRGAKKLYDQPYGPEKDFWRILRMGIIEMHQSEAKPATLDGILQSLRDPRKQHLYPGCIEGYRQWLGRRNAKWMGAKAASWICDDLVVNVNPELGLDLNGRQHIIKLYFKKEPLTKRRVQAILHLLQTAAKDDHNAIKGILDVPRSRFISYENSTVGIEALLHGEARSFATMWHAL